MIKIDRSVREYWQLPLKARHLFSRRYQSMIKKYSIDKATSSALSLVKTRWKKVKGKWVER